MRFLILLIIFPSSAIGQELNFLQNATELCVSEAADRTMAENCIGSSAELCMTENGADGSSTVGMGYCLTRELEYWDERLNTAYRSLREIDRADDAELEDLNSAAPIRVTALREMQRAWIGYRDAACFYEFSEWGGGTGGGPAHAACLMQITGAQALRLEAKLEDRR